MSAFIQLTAMKIEEGFIHSTSAAATNESYSRRLLAEFLVCCFCLSRTCSRKRGLSASERCGSTGSSNLVEACS